MELSEQNSGSVERVLELHLERAAGLRESEALQRKVRVTLGH
jgi:hypothetical protein